MAATVVVQKLTGAALGNGRATTKTTVSLVRLCMADLAVPGLTFPIPRPSAGAVRSFWSSYGLAMTGITGSIQAIKYDTDRTPFANMGTGGQVYIGQRSGGDTAGHGCPDDEYSRATGDEGEDGDSISTDHPYYTGGGHGEGNLFSKEWLVDTGMDGVTAKYGPSVATQYSNHVVVQIQLAADCAIGVAAAETCRWIYDEI